MYQQNRFATVMPVAIILIVAALIIRMNPTGESNSHWLENAKTGNEASVDVIANTEKPKSSAVNSFGTIGEVAPFRPIPNNQNSSAKDFPVVDESSAGTQYKSNEYGETEYSATKYKATKDRGPQPQLDETFSKPAVSAVTENSEIETSIQQNVPVSVFRVEKPQAATDQNANVTLNSPTPKTRTIQPAGDFKTPGQSVAEAKNSDNASAINDVNDVPADRNEIETGPMKELATGRTYQALPPNVVNQSLSRIEYGSSLARRGAIFGARQEFVAALRSIAEACDIQQNSGNEHAQSLSLGLAALHETKDFATLSQQLDIGAALAATVSGHQCGVVSAEQARTMSTNAVLQAYFKFAQDKITAGCGPYPISSYAFFSLGKLHTMNHKMNIGDDVYDQAKSIVMHRAALVSDPNNFQSANELGVILAQSGQLHDAEKILQHGLAIHPTVEMWNNLAVVHEQLGDGRLAAAARNESQILSQTLGQRQTHAQVQWVAPDDFDRNAQAAPIGIAPEPQSQQPAMQQSPAANSPYPNASTHNDQQSSPWWEQMGNMFQ